MILCGIGDEAGNSLASQLLATQTLGWRHLEARNIVVPGFPKANLHELPEPAFELAVAQLAGGKFTLAEGPGGRGLRAMLELPLARS